MLRDEVEEEYYQVGSRGGLLICGCRWRFGSDDFVFPAWCEVFLRALGLFFLLGVSLSEATLGDSYTRVYHLETFLFGMVFISLMTSINMGFLGINSMKGWIWDSRPDIRELVIPLIYINIWIFSMEICWNTLGTYWVSSALRNTQKISISGTSSMLLIAIFIVILSSWLGIFLKIFLSVAAFKKVEGCKKSISDEIVSYLSKPQDFKIIADVLSYVFHDADFVPTDVAAALLLLNNESNNFIKSMDECNSFVNEEIDVIEIEHYMKYATASYGCINTLLQNKKVDFFYNVLIKGSCPFLKSGVENALFEAPFCSCFNILSINFQIPTEEKNSIIYINLHNDITKTPYYVALDCPRKNIIIAVRGTLSIKDALTDLMASPTKIDEYEDFYAHNGMLKAARNIYSDLKNNEIIDRTLALYDDFNIIVTGHSLGAGTAVILTLMLRILYKSTKCFAYSPPGGLICGKTRIESLNFVTSIIVGDDFIPRLSLPNLSALISKMKNALLSCKLPKYKILGYSIFKNLNGRNNLLEDKILIEDTNNESVNLSSTQQHSHIFNIPLVLPGKLIHVVKTETQVILRKAFISDFSSIIVSTDMLSDHLPTTILEVLKLAHIKKSNNSFGSI